MRLSLEAAPFLPGTGTTKRAFFLAGALASADLPFEAAATVSAVGGSALALSLVSAGFALDGTALLASAAPSAAAFLAAPALPAAPPFSFLGLFLADAPAPVLFAAAAARPCASAAAAVALRL